MPTKTAARRRACVAHCVAAAGLALLAGCAAPPQHARPEPEVLELPAPARPQDPEPEPEFERGKASWYGPRFHGRRTASGERFDMNELTAAHPSLPFGTRVRVRNVQNRREVVVRINDRGPYMKDRIIDLSKAAAAALDLLEAGEARVVLSAP